MRQYLIKPRTKTLLSREWIACGLFICYHMHANLIIGRDSRYRRCIHFIVGCVSSNLYAEGLMCAISGVTFAHYKDLSLSLCRTGMQRCLEFKLSSKMSKVADR